ncbi:MAG: ATP synthase subunit I [Peptostreptococcaceae bacterium]
MDSNLLYEIKRVTKGILYYYLVLSIILILSSNFNKEMLLGLMFGCIIAVLNFRLLAITIHKSVNMPPAKAQVYSGLQYSVRMFVIFIVLLVSVNQPHLNIIGVTLGLLGPKFIILFDKFVIQKFSRKEAN